MITHLMLTGRRRSWTTVLALSIAAALFATWHGVFAAEPAPAPAAAEQPKPESPPAPAPATEKSPAPAADAKPEAPPAAAPAAEKSAAPDSKPEATPAAASKAETPAAPASKPETPPPSTTAAERPPAPAPEPAPADTTAKPAAPAAAEEPAKPVERKLQFSFRYQKWSDVLDWFAEQSELSLVMDNPPPGTFNYTDSREFTVSEAMDVLNSVLMTKGYTLVRRSRMLLVLNTADGIPADLVPRVTKAELDQRGNFELVSMVLDLGRRDPEVVKTEVTPLLTPLGHVVVLPQTKQVLVTESVWKMRIIASLVESIPERPIPPEQPKPVPPEKPELTVYPLQNSDPAKVQEVLKQLFASATMVADATAKQISIYGTPSQQASIKKMIDQMEANQPPDLRPRLEVYKLSPRLVTAATGSRRATAATSTTLLTQLQAIVPEMKLLFDETERRLIAWGAPKDHETLKATLDKLEGQQPAAQPVQVEAFRITKLDPASITTMVESLFPYLDFTMDAASRTLIVAAPPEDLLAIRNLLEQLQPAQQRPDSPTLKVLPLKEPAASDLTKMLQSLAPAAQVSLTADASRLVVVASPADLEAIQKAVEQLEQGAPPMVRNSLKFYSVTPAQRTRFEAILTNLTTELPGLRVIKDAEPGELAVWAKPEQHAVLSQILDELKRDVPQEEQYRLFVHPLQPTAAAKVVPILQELYPQLKVIQDPAKNRLLVWTTAAQFAALQQTLQELQPGAAADQQPQFKVYTLRGVAADTAVAQVQPLVPDAKLSVETATGRLIAWATPADQEVLAKALQDLSTSLAAAEQRQVEVFPLGRFDPTATLSLLQSLLPSAKLSVDTANSRLIAHAVPQDLLTVRALLEQLSAGGKDPNAPVVEFYPLQKPLDAAASAALAKLVPNAQVTAQDDRLLVVAAPADQELIQKAVEKWEQGAPPLVRNSLKFYSVTPAQRTRFEAILTNLTTELPGLRVIKDAEPGELAVWARPEQHTVLAQVLEEMKRDVPEEDQYRLFVHPLSPTAAAKVVPIVQELYPQLKVIQDPAKNRLLVWTTAAQFALLQKTIQDLQPDPAADQQAQYKVYVLRGVTAETAIAQVQPLVPDAKLSAETATGRLIVWAIPADHETVAKALQNLSVSLAAADARQVEIFPLSKVDPTATLALLQSLLPTAKLSLDTPNNRLIAHALPEDLLTVRTVLEQLGERGTDGDYRLVAYALQVTEAAKAKELLTGVYPGAKITVDDKSNRLLIWARSADHEAIKASIAEMDVGNAVDWKEKIMVYPMPNMDGTSAVAFLRELIPEAKLSYDTAARTLTVRARGKDHETIAEVIRQMQSGGDPATRAQVQVHPGPFENQDDVLALLRALEPNARIVANRGTGGFAIFGTPREQESLRSTLEQIQAQGEETAYGLRGFKLETISAERAIPLLEAAVPGVTFTTRRDPQKLIAWGRKDQLEKVSQIIEQLQADGVYERLKVRVYSVKATSASVVTSFLSRMSPGAIVTPGSDPQQVIVWATEADHAVIAESLKELEAEVADGSLVIHQVKGVTGAVAVSLLSAAVPQARVSSSGDPQRILVWAKPEEQKLVEQLLRQIEQQGLQDDRVLAVYPLGDADIASAQKALAPVLGTEVQVVPDESRKSLIVWATAAKHEQIQKTLDQLVKLLPEPIRPLTKVYHLKNATASAAYYAVTRMVPTATLGLDTVGNNLIATASAEDHELMATTVQQIDEAGVEEKNVAIYPLENADLTSTVSVLQTLFPAQTKATISADARRRSVVVLAPPERQTEIAKVIAQLEEKGTRDDMTLTVYPLESEDSTAFLKVLQPLLEQGITHSHDTRRNSLIVWGTAEQHEKIRQAMQQLAVDLPEPEQLVTQIYHLQNATASSAYTALTPLVPKATLGLDTAGNNLAVTASAEDHEKIRVAVEQLDQAGAKEDAAVRVYNLQDADPTSVATMLQSLFVSERNIRVTADTKNRAVLAVAPEGRQAFIADVVKQLESSAAGRDMTTKVYRFEVGSPYAAYLALYTSLPNARMGYDLQAKTLVVTGTAEDHEAVAAVVKDMDQAGLEDRPEVKIYRLPTADLTSVATALQVQFSGEPRVRISVDTVGKALIAVAPPDEQKMIEQMIQQVEAGGPGGGALTTEVYHFKKASPLAAYQALSTRIPTTRLGYDVTGRNLVVTGTADDHELVRAVVGKIEETAQEDEATLKVYPLKTADPTNVATVLRTLYARDAAVSVSADTRNRTVVVVAPAEQQSFVQTMIQQMETQGPDQQQWTTVVYHFKGANAVAAYSALSSLLPEAKMAYDSAARNLIVTARPEDHAIVKTTVEDLDKAGLADRGTMQVYPLKQADPTSVYTALLALYRSDPNVRLTADAVGRTIIAVAGPEEQQLIQQMIEKLDSQQIVAEGWTTEVYHFQAATPAAAQEYLEKSVPQARIVVDTAGRNLIITASPGDHETIKRTIEQMDKASLADKGTLRIYPIESADANSVFEALQTLYRGDPKVSISVDLRSRSIIAMAPEEQQQSLQEVIQQLETRGSAQAGWTTQVYHLKRSDPSAARTVLTDLLPEAEIAYDYRGRNLLATASAKDHEAIKAVVEQLDQASMEDRSAPRVYRLQTADLEDVYEVLQNLYARSTETQVSLDRNQQAIVAIATPEEHETIQRLIEELERAGLGTQGTELRSYDLGEADGDAVLEMLESLLDKEVKAKSVRLSILPQNNMLIAVARPKEQELIQKSLEGMKVEDRELEVFQLQTVDPYAAELAIESLFDSPGRDGWSAPSVNSDYVTQQLFVRGTKKQLEDVRNLLVKMGEIQLSATRRQPGTSGTLRVIPFGGDTQSAIDEIQRIWPQLRKNEIRVITPGDSIRRVRPSVAPSEEPQPSPNGPAPASPPADRAPPSSQAVPTSRFRIELAAFESASQTQPAGEKPESPPSAAAAAPANTASEAASVDESSSPVLIVPGDGSITIASQDAAALDQIEALLAALARGQSGAGRNFVVFSLKNTAATDVAETIERLFRAIGSDWRGGTGKVVAVPDERLNSIVVYAGRADQAVVENLVRILDSAEIPDSLALIRPKMIPVKNTRARDIEQVLRDIYRTQLTMGGGRRQVEIPRGVSTEVASVLRQINAATTGPLLTLGSDDLSNTLIVMAPADLADEITEVVKQLDEAALGENPAQSLKIMSLKKLNSDRLDEALNMLLRHRSRRTP